MSAGEQQPPDWNPYQQAGYHQDNPYQQPTVPMGQAGGGPPQGPGPGVDKSHRTKMTLAIAASVAMVAAVTVGGVMLVGNSDEGSQVAQPADDDTDGDDTGEDPDAGDTGGEDPDGGDTEGGDTEGEDTGGDDTPDDPRGGTKPQFDPVAGSDWNVQALADRDIVYDVPPDWTVDSPTMMYQWNLVIDGEESGFYTIKGPASSPMDTCGNEPAVAGTTGERGAADTAAAAKNSAYQYVLGVYDNNQKGTLNQVEPEPFSNEHGFEGHIASATVEGFPEVKENEDDPDSECHPPGGKVVVVSFVTPGGDIASFLIISDTGVDGGLDDETIEKMTGSLRHYEER